MKHIFTFLLALCTCAYASAATIPVAPGENHIAEAFASAQAGDVLEFSTGNYYEWSTLTIDKAITFKAAEGNAPVVKFNVLSITNDFEANGLTIENLSNSNYLLRTGGNVAGTIAIKNCTLHNPVASPYIYLSSNTVETLIIDNCIFSECTKNESALVSAGSATVTNFSMTNCTAYNMPYVLAVRLDHVTNALVDHCTFYNCGTRPVYLAGTLTTCEVKNCAVVAPEVPGSNNYCIATYGGTVDNCLYYNLSAPRSSSATVTNCTAADPLFVDAANANFSFTYASPLYLGATDGTNIGDPRWSAQAANPVVDLPTTLNMANAEGYTAPVYNTDYFDFGPNDSSNDLKFYAMWVVNHTPCAYNVSAVAESTNGFTLVLYLINAETGEVIKTLSGTNKQTDLGAWDLTDVPAGQYLLKLQNTTEWSKVKVQSVTLASAGGAVVNIPASLSVDDALFSSNGTRANGEISFTNIASGWVKWNVAVTKAGNYAITVNINNQYGHNYTVALYDEDENLVGTALTEGSTVYTKGTPLAIPMGTMSMPAGNYTLKVTNSVNGSDAKLIGVDVVYTGGATIAMPGVVVAEDALEMSGKVEMNADGNIAYINNAAVPDARVKWNISIAEAGSYQVTLNIHADNTSGHNFTCEVRNSADAVVATIGEETNKWTKGDQVLGDIVLPVGNYTLVLINNTAYSATVLDGITFAYNGPVAAPTYDLTITTAEMSTLILPFDVTSLPAGLSVYRLTTSAADEIVATEESSILADKPVLVTGAAGVYHFEGTGSADISAKTGVYTNGALHGTYTSMEAPLSEGGEYSYVLQNQGGVVAFYQLLESSNKTINPYRAYLRAAYNASAASGAPMRIRFGAQTPTDIEALQTVTLEEALRRGEVYDLTGRRVGAISGQGVYIIAGQKLYIH